VEAARCVGVEGSVSAEALDWADSAAFLQNSAAGPPWAWVLCSDCVYHQQLDFRPVQALARLLAALTEPRADGSPPPVCLFGYQERDSAARYAFWDALSANGLQVRERSLASASFRCLRGLAFSSLTLNRLAGGVCGRGSGRERTQRTYGPMVHLAQSRRDAAARTSRVLELRQSRT